MNEFQALWFITIILFMIYHNALAKVLMKGFYAMCGIYFYIIFFLAAGSLGAIITQDFSIIDVLNELIIPHAAMAALILAGYTMLWCFATMGFVADTAFRAGMRSLRGDDEKRKRHDDSIPSRLIDASHHELLAIGEDYSHSHHSARR